jgi:hypothetical protein
MPRQHPHRASLPFPLHVVSWYCSVLSLVYSSLPSISTVIVLFVSLYLYSTSQVYLSYFLQV